jgi:hypothetical protein
MMMMILMTSRKPQPKRMMCARPRQPTASLSRFSFLCQRQLQTAAEFVLAFSAQRELSIGRERINR